MFPHNASPQSTTRIRAFPSSVNQVPRGSPACATPASGTDNSVHAMTTRRRMVVMAFLSVGPLYRIPTARKCGSAIHGYRADNDEGFRFLTRTAKMPSLHDFLA